MMASVKVLLACWTVIRVSVNTQTKGIWKTRRKKKKRKSSQEIEVVTGWEERAFYRLKSGERAES